MKILMFNPTSNTTEHNQLFQEENFGPAAIEIFLKENEFTKDYNLKFKQTSTQYNSCLTGRKVFFQSLEVAAASAADDDLCSAADWKLI